MVWHLTHNSLKDAHEHRDTIRISEDVQVPPDKPFIYSSMFSIWPASPINLGK